MLKYLILIALLGATEVWAQQQPASVSGELRMWLPLFDTYLDKDDPPPIRVAIPLDGNALATFSGEYVSDWSSMESFHFANIEIFGGFRPQAAAEAVTVACPDPISGSVINDRASARARLFYEVRIAQRQEPPLVFFPPLELFADVRAEVSYTGQAFSNVGVASGISKASVSVSNPSIVTPFNRLLTILLREEGEDTRAERWGFRARPGDIIRVRLTAEVETSVSAELEGITPAVHESEAGAIADPFFGFDQNAFDQRMAEAGLETFPLTEYFELVYSPNLLESTPVLFRDGFEQFPESQAEWTLGPTGSRFDLHEMPLRSENELCDD